MKSSPFFIYIYICGETHIVALLPLSSSPQYSTATLSFSSISLSFQLQSKRNFPSRHLDKDIDSTSHA